MDRPPADGPVSSPETGVFTSAAAFSQPLEAATNFVPRVHLPVEMQPEVKGCLLGIRVRSGFL